MKLNRLNKRIIVVLASLLVAILVVVANVTRVRSQVRGIDVSLRYKGTPALVSQQTVADTVLRHIPNLLTLSVKDVDFDQVAEAARQVPYLTKVSASVSVSGKVVVRAEQRRPMARLFYGNREMYMDREGALFPVSDMGNCNVLVAGGDFTEPLRKDSLNAQLQSLWQVASFLDEERKFSELIDQIYVESDGDVMMAPKVGNHVIELGDADKLDEKLDNLLTFYRKGLPIAGWDTYSSVSLRFRNQVVCKKNK
jgi:cell division protein FtsQ